MFADSIHTMYIVFFCDNVLYNCTKINEHILGPYRSVPVLAVLWLLVSLIYMYPIYIKWTCSWNFIIVFFHNFQVCCVTRSKATKYELLLSIGKKELGTQDRAIRQWQRLFDVNLKTANEAEEKFQELRNKEKISRSLIKKVILIRS